MRMPKPFILSLKACSQFTISLSIGLPEFGAAGAQVLESVVPEEAEDPMEVAEPEEAEPGAPGKLEVRYCERFVEFLVDLLSQLPTRRFVRTLLEDKAILVKCKMSPLMQHGSGDCSCMEPRFSARLRVWCCSGM